MPEYLAPGVYVEEVPLRSKGIEGVPTNTAAFLGETERGPTEPTLVESLREFVARFGDEGRMPRVMRGFFENGGHRCLVGRVVDEGNATHASAFVASLGFRVRAVGVGAWGRDIRVAWESAPDSTGGLRMTVTYKSVGETFDLPGPGFHVSSNLVAIEALEIPDAPIAAGATMLDVGGSDGAAAGVGDYAARLAQVDGVQVVYAPDALEVPGLAEVLLRDCEARRDRFCVLDAMEGHDASHPDLLRRYGLDSRCGALYMPWLKAADGEFVPPGGHVAGIYARVDAERGVWKAPANETVRGVTGLRFDVDAAQQDLLNPMGINAIRAFAGRGIRVWGARTLSSDPEWKYVNVRRLFTFVEESIERGTRWVVFEPNGEPLWSEVRRGIENFLAGLWRAGALPGARPREAYFVRCDRSTMTQGDIDNGRLVVEIGVAAVKPAEFTIFRIGQKTADSG